jgi:hypothetical protein
MGANLLNCPILSESRAEERREDESKDPDDMSFNHVASGSFSEGLLRQVFPSRIHLLDQRNLLFPAPDSPSRRSSLGFRSGLGRFKVESVGSVAVSDPSSLKLPEAA